jgi:hypothetical protein
VVVADTAVVAAAAVTKVAAPAAAVVTRVAAPAAATANDSENPVLFLWIFSDLWSLTNLFVPAYLSGRYLRMGQSS